VGTNTCRLRTCAQLTPSLFTPPSIPWFDSFVLSYTIWLDTHAWVAGHRWAIAGLASPAALMVIISGALPLDYVLAAGAWPCPGGRGARATHIAGMAFSLGLPAPFLMLPPSWLPTPFSTGSICLHLSGALPILHTCVAFYVAWHLVLVCQDHVSCLSCCLPPSPSSCFD